MTEHLCHIQIEGFYAIALNEREVGVASGLANHIQRSTFTLGNTAHMVDMLLVDKQSHTLLTLIGNDFLGRQCLVADGQLGHVDTSAALLNQLGETVQMTGGAMVVNTYYRVVILFHQGTHQVIGTFLHLGVGTLYGIQLNTVTVTARIY